MKVKWLFYSSGALLIIAGAALAVERQAPLIRYDLGLTPQVIPYVSRLQPEAQPSTGAQADLSSDPEQESSPLPALPQDNRLVVPKIGLNLAILEGPDSSTLDEGIWRAPEAGAPGAGRNTIIAGHRKKNAFVLLDKLRPGDDVIVYWRGQEYDYRVTSVTVVPPDQTDILEPGSQERLTLYTCLPRSQGNKRVVVQAEPYLMPS